MELCLDLNWSNCELIKFWIGQTIAQKMSVYQTILLYFCLLKSSFNRMYEKNSLSFVEFYLTR
jgi:hypothetical protein